MRLSNVQHPCDRLQKNPAAPIIGLCGDVAAGGMGAEPAPLFAETCTVEPVQYPGVNTPGEGDGGNSLNRVVVVPFFVVALTEGVGHPLGRGSPRGRRPRSLMCLFSSVIHAA